MEIVIFIIMAIAGLFLFLIIVPMLLFYVLLGSRLRLAEKIAKRQILFMQQVFRPDLSKQNQDRH